MKKDTWTNVTKAFDPPRHHLKIPIQTIRKNMSRHPTTTEQTWCSWRLLKLKANSSQTKQTVSPSHRTEEITILTCSTLWTPTISNHTPSKHTSGRKSYEHTWRYINFSEYGATYHNSTNLTMKLQRRLNCSSKKTMPSYSIPHLTCPEPTLRNEWLEHGNITFWWYEREHQRCTIFQAGARTWSKQTSPSSRCNHAPKTRIYLRMRLWKACSCLMP